VTLRFSSSYFLCALCLTLVLGLSACGKSGGEDQARAASSDSTATATDGDKPKGKSKNAKDDLEAKKNAPVPVDVTVLERGSIEALTRASANLEAESTIMVRAEAARRVTQLLVEEGHHVTKGQTLAKLQDAEQRSALAGAQSQYDKNASELARQKALREQDLSSDQALLDAQYASDQAKIALDNAQRELTYATVRAPIVGTVTMRKVNLGDQVQIGQELFEIVDFESIVARVYIPEKNLSEIAVGQEARITARAVSGEPFVAKVLRIAPVVDPQTGTVKVTVAVGEQPGLLPGLFVEVALVTMVHDNALLVPKRALMYDNDQTFVFRIGAERKVERLLVEPVLADRFYVEPASGLAPGDSIVIAGQTGLKNGTKIRLITEEPASQADTDKPKPDGADGETGGDVAQES
jgi:membrane fusion protein (multidrug efflux system)